MGCSPSKKSVLVDLDDVSLDHSPLKPLPLPPSAFPNTAWAAHGGGAVEAALRPHADHNDQPPLRLLDARWLYKCWQKDGRMEQRAILPAEAFISLEQLVELRIGAGATLPILCIAAPWMNPDKDGKTLSRIGEALHVWLSASLHGYAKTYGVLWDLGAMPNQKDTGLLQLALEGMGELYSHPHTTVLQLGTPSAANAPEAYRLSA